MTKRQLLNIIIKESISLIDFDYMNYFITYDITISNTFILISTYLWKNEKHIILKTHKVCNLKLDLNKEEVKKKIQKFYSLVHKSYINAIDSNKNI